jgi:hypothetical protein
LHVGAYSSVPSGEIFASKIRNEFHEYSLGHNAYKDKICGVKKEQTQE